MTDPAPSLLQRKTVIRLFSALVALTLLFGTLAFAGRDGLVVLTGMVVFLLIREVNRILFNETDHGSIKVLYTSLVFSVFGLTVLTIEFSAVALAVLAILFFSATLITSESVQQLDLLSGYLSKALLGFFYVGLLPGIACNLLYLNHGEVWFFALLAIVFTGDSAAYFTGRFFGRTALMPSISPKKTLEGALGGLLGSMLAGWILVQIEQELPLYPILLISVLGGVCGQLGDLFESLLKRVANKKDSGTLMPGHGGMLDRLDGVLFAAPVVFAGATLVERFFT